MSSIVNIDFSSTCLENRCICKKECVNIRYFFIKDRIQEDDINIIYCPTGSMVADYFTKPLQGSLFKKLRDVIMGVTHPDSLLDNIPPLAKERVGLNSDKVSVVVNADDMSSGGRNIEGEVKTRNPTDMRIDRVKPTYAQILVCGEPGKPG